MGWKGTLRSIEAASRRAERESRRKQRELAQKQLELSRMQGLQDTYLAAAVFENHLNVITSVHKECGEPIDWQAIASMPEPSEPQRLSYNEAKARASAEQYTPSFAERLQRKVEHKRAELAADIEAAKERDDLDYQQRLDQYRQEIHDWQINRKIAEGILVGRADAYMEAIQQLSPSAELGELGSSFGFRIENDDASLIEVTVRVNEDTVIPRQTVTALKSGKISRKDMPKTRFWALYQDYICGAALRIARELFALVPTEMVIVTALGQVLNMQTGHMEEQPILSVAMPRTTIEQLNFDLLDPSDSMQNFVHNMKFYKTKGFVPVDRLNAADFRRVSGDEEE
jgi:hypothetical protein